MFTKVSLIMFYLGHLTIKFYKAKLKTTPAPYPKLLNFRTIYYISSLKNRLYWLKCQFKVILLIVFLNNIIYKSEKSSQSLLFTTHQPISVF